MCFAFVSHVSAQGAQEAAANANRASKAALSVEKQDRFINLVRNISQRMDGVVNRLADVTARLETRMSILESQGVDTASARTSLSDAQNKLGETRQALIEAQAHAEAALMSETPRESFKSARTEFANVRSTIRDAYIFLRETVIKLKDAVEEAEQAGLLNGTVRNAPVETTEDAVLENE